MSVPKISIIIPTYGRAEYLKNLLESVRCSTPKGAYEFVVVSSDSIDSSKTKWLKKQEDVVLIVADPRSGGRRKKSLYYYTNLGIYQAKHEWVFVVNDDMHFDSDWYNELRDILFSSDNVNVGMVVVATHIGDASLGCRVAKIGRTRKGNGLWKDLYLSDLSLISREVLKMIGYFDERLDWFGSGADNSLAVEFLTDKNIVIAEKIKVIHHIAEENRLESMGDAFEDFNYLRKKWDKWCLENNCQYECGFGVEQYTLKNRLIHFVRKSRLYILIKSFLKGVIKKGQ